MSALGNLKRPDGLPPKLKLGAFVKGRKDLKQQGGEVTLA